MENYSENPIIVDVANMGQIETLKKLIAEGIDIEETNESGLNALLMAAKRNDTEMVEFLLLAGANPKVKDCYGRSFKYWARQYNNIKMVQLMVKTDKNENSKNSNRNLIHIPANFFKLYEEFEESTNIIK